VWRQAVLARAQQGANRRSAVAVTTQHVVLSHARRPSPWGPQGDGNLQLRISEAELQVWFEALDHVLPHTRVALSEITCAEDGEQRGALRRPRVVVRLHVVAGLP
jgi:hypothetical protein